MRSKERLGRGDAFFAKDVVCSKGLFDALLSHNARVSPKGWAPRGLRYHHLALLSALLVRQYKFSSLYLRCAFHSLRCHCHPLNLAARVLWTWRGPRRVLSGAGDLDSRPREINSGEVWNVNKHAPFSRLLTKQHHWRMCLSIISHISCSYSCIST
ncbi:CYFA0S03e04555g1_1 [Cyberlindnera fabianii]|uniref:CYFA0S03e04555g1_1 n=1 Tax=Cyberlindnera fabianii TaxID=36022 RepID=A0A061APU3_CYBFA|nr:CYFA0S03e04555g1_1 [Cyberlindnera fabianii]